MADPVTSLRICKAATAAVHLRTRSAWWKALTALIWLLLSACSDSSLVRDTAVDTFVEAELQITIQEDLRIPITSDGASPSHIKGMSVSDDGRIAILDSHRREILIFTKTGAHVATAGGYGPSAGQLADPHGLELGVDGLLWVPDSGNQRMTRFDHSGRYISHSPMPFSSWGQRWGGMIDTNGKVWDTQLLALGTGPQMVLRGFTPDMAWTDTIQLPRRAAGRAQSVFRFRRGAMLVPFYPVQLQAYDKAGYRWITDNTQYKIAKTTLSGDTLLSLEQQRPMVWINKRHRDSAIAAVRRRSEGQRIDLSRIPRVHMPIQGLSVDDASNLWVRVKDNTTEGTTYDVYSPDGKFVATAKAKFNVHTFAPLVIRAGYLYVISMDSAGGPTVLRGYLGSIGDK